VVSIFAVVYSLLVEQKWTSTVSFMPSYSSSQTSSAMNNLLSGGLGSFLGSNQARSEVLDLLTSRTLLEEVIEQFDLISFFEIEDDDTYMIRHKILEKIRDDVLSVGQNEETGIVKISVTTPDRFLSAKIADYIVKELDHYYRYDRLTKGKEEREFLEKRIQDIQQEMNELSASIKFFQKEYNLLELDKQMPPLLTSYTEVVSEYLATELSVNVLKNYLPPINEQVKREEYKLKELLKQIQKMETGNKSIISYQVPLDSIPTITQKYTLLKTKSDILKKTYEVIFPQFELAKLQELRDTATIQIIDDAVPAGQRTYPKRAKFCIIAFFMAFWVSSFFSIIYESIKKSNIIERLKQKHNYQRK
jgi:uncharacterized protein involved in exopolysaccharide biosynthesis